ncbi:Fusaric acid resistance protein-like-domain-containing protein [Mycena galopus ATCC 62051]|nr:Fusaric acid resistance protein-like-domain-containing protein [Mycena galopus ATCC 62051]
MNPPQNNDWEEYSDSNSGLSVGATASARWLPFQYLPNIPLQYRNIFKCAVAYLIGSLFTFSPYLSGFVNNFPIYGDVERRQNASGHLIATVAVLFDPAKTMGGMIEADLYCFGGLVFSAFICLSSMTVFWWLETKPGWEWLAAVLVIVWIGVSMSVVAWMKVWMASSSFNVACSMTSIVIFVVLIKEGDLGTLLQVSFTVICGLVTSNLVCYAIWPQSATSALQANITTTLDSFSTLLDLVTYVFLLEEQPSDERLAKAMANHQSSFTSLKQNLKEAQSEWVAGRSGAPEGRLGRAYEDAVDSMNRLAQHLNGLRGGTRLQVDLTKSAAVGQSKKMPGNDGCDGQNAEPSTVPTAVFGGLFDELRPPLKELSTTCTSSLLRMREAFLKSRRGGERYAFEQHEFFELVEGIERALLHFESTSNDAVLRLYRRSAGSHFPAGVGDTEDTEPTSNTDSEYVFVVYFFIFTLQEFATELVSLVDAMGRIYSIEQLRASRARWWTRIFRWSHRNPRSGASTLHHSSRRPRMLKASGLQRRLSKIMIPTHRRTHPSFPKVRPHAPNTIQTPAWDRLTWVGKVKQHLWTTGRRLAESDTKYAFKAGMAAALLAAPAFFETTRPIFMGLWGHWSLITFLVVISPTIGATNFLSIRRVLGNVFGAAVAALVFTLFPENPIVLSLFGFFFSIPCFYYNNSSSRFVLLTYNLTCLYCYNLRGQEVSPVNVGIRRAIAVTVGVVWAALVSRFWWPAEARRELSKALGEFCLNIGWLYTRLVASNSYAQNSREVAEEYGGSESETQPLAPENARLTSSIKEFMAMELHLQIKLIELQGLLDLTQHEPRLKGPFPVELYRGILASLQTILDKLHSIRCVTTREEWQSVRQDFILPVNKERREMVGNIILSFSTLASAFHLKAPLPPYLPSPEASRQRLVTAIRKLEVVRNREVKGSRQLLFFAYALSMKGVTVELEILGRTLQNAFGVIGQTPEEFEALFAERNNHSV